MSPPRRAVASLPARLAALATLGLMGCGPSLGAPADFVDCQPRLDFFSSEPAFSQAARLTPVGASQAVGFAFDEACPLDLAALAPTATAFRPDTSTQPLDVRLWRADERVLAEVAFTPDVPGWWMVELSLDPGWARRQVLVRAVENRAGAARVTEQVNGDLSRCLDVQRTPGGTWVCRATEGAYQLRADIPAGFLGQQALLVGDVAWATDGARVVRFVDSPTGLRVVASLPGDLLLYSAEREVALVGPPPQSGTPLFSLVRFDGTATLVSSPSFEALDAPVLLDGGVVFPCPGALCGSRLLGRFGPRVLATDQGGDRPRLVALDGGAVEPLDVGPGRVQPLSVAGVAGNLPAVWSSSREPVLLRVPDEGAPRMEWLGPGLFGASSTHAFLRGARANEAQVVPLGP